MSAEAPRRGLYACVVALVLANAAIASPLRGTTYRGHGADGATLKFTIARNGRLVDSYAITKVIGKQGKHGACNFIGEGMLGHWQGATIVHGQFRYTLGSELTFRGSFTGRRSASGTFRFYNPPVATTPSCSTGIVHWTAQVTR